MPSPAWFLGVPGRDRTLTDVGLPNEIELLHRVADDGEFRMAVRHWTGGFRISVGDEAVGLTVTDGALSAGTPTAGDVIALAGPADVWQPMLQTVPPRFANTVATMISRGLELDADPVVWWQYLPATERLIELLRAPGDAAPTSVNETRIAGSHDAPVGRYVNLSIDGVVHRIYYEEAGSGIPVLLQHTAGAHGVQWRHLFESPEITERFRLIAYDLPFHGKSLPPTSTPWWHEEYRLTGETLRQVPVGLAAALDLVDPVFMGCSVGGLLALDLALHHPDVFRAVVSVEGALHIGGDYEAMPGFWHPQVSNMSKARMMEGLCSPTSPVPYVKEVSQTYSAGWPPVFLGDLWYYVVDFDLRDEAAQIDTAQCEVHILNGEYDYSGTVERGLVAHEAIAGSTHRAMPGVGHFPMVEQPDRFIAEILPILEGIAAGTAGHKETIDAV